MTITVRYSAQARLAAGVASEDVELVNGSALRDLLGELARRHGPAMERVLLDEEGSPRSSILLCVGDRQVSPTDQRQLAEGDEVTILPFIAGG